MKQVLLTFLFIFLPMLVSAEPVEIEGVWYNLVAKSNMAEVTYNPEGYTYYSENIDIPETVTNESVIYNVTCIGDNAFENNRDLLSVKLPNSITSIGKKSFRDCYSLTTINIPKSVKTIGDEAFFGCNNISVEISDIEAWCSIVFNDLSSNPLCYGNKILLNGEEIKDLVIPSSVTNIGDYLFCGWRFLESVKFHNNITSIGIGAFFGCSGLVNINIPNSVTTIGGAAFSGCSGLTSFTIPNNVTSIGAYAFQGCSGLTSISIPINVKSIENGLFSNCTSLSVINIPDDISSIGEKAFHYCSSLKSITIPNSVSVIKREAFYYCTNLNSVIFGNKLNEIREWAFMHCSSLSSLHLPNSLKTIKEAAFMYCSGLTTLTIGNSISKIENSVFASCEELTDVYCLSEKVPTTSSNVFRDSYPQAITLHVPSTSLDKYKKADPWKYFKEIISLVDSDIQDTPEKLKCAKPSINIENGIIKFSCETEGVEYVSEVTVSDAKIYYDHNISAPKSFKVTVYATKMGYENSENATAEFDFSRDTAKSGDVDGNGEVNVADHVKLSSIILNK